MGHENPVKQAAAGIVWLARLEKAGATGRCYLEQELVLRWWLHPRRTLDLSAVLKEGASACFTIIATVEMPTRSPASSCPARCATACCCCPSVLLEQEIVLQPTEVKTDTGAYTDVMFGIFYRLGPWRR